ncbi:glucose/arabinose dehydrogenase/azurin [Dyadobacter sp. BE34]|uniref:Glucose/arabinose dehydrogenase/azurin n=1 Tax=Dyadobacter fermentans TaxID=94254 RepID=A0ABU1R0F4_9BACT|nr:MULTISPECIES: PVC-type heme-binding CxxCH protein [Dyadobacter]MDR6806892.1 glucose/arabinose dehydrogenase/azurin [Dyadobacter fermentans]MDR7044634.1 glucose/arabinose dehydrogenase/azurin [Dyadobacter sp. BE242]MDR7198944.1 glucose/arabinose dehydrogenase/azurin [Dyadobacter sp. BE34]MDR7216906.1 glucose/arabinose dehydrogenase/azurin [Dyadobacter sp. BE31]MDR7263568.1 glucose/arabinose dehydrogenase/azurin [Dyadobacter sp. BE32]
MKSIFQHFLPAMFMLSVIFVKPSAGQAPNPGFVPKTGDRIILLGNTFADRMRHYGYFETLLQKNFPDRQLTLRNMGWSADEVGLQPRPLNFPGFGEKTKRLTEGQKEVKFQGFTHEGERIVMPVALNFEGLNQDLYDQQADIIFLCFGMNEAFKGPAGLPQFEKDLGIFIQNLQKNHYNGSSTPALVLVSPIAHEAMGEHFPNPAEHNRNLALYTKAMQKAASAKGLYFIDLYTPSLALMQHNSRPKLTINGIHLTDAGYKQAAEWMGRSLGFGKMPDWYTENTKKLLAVIKMKDDHFFYRWRAVNGEYIYGRRREPFGVIAFPPELRKLNQMTASLDSVIWEMGKSNDAAAFGKAVEIVDRRGKPIDPMLMTDVPMTGRQGEAAKAAAHANHEKMWPATTDKFKLPEGYQINLFASEKDFPIEKPVAMNFDARGRLWVATMPTYPQYFPGIPVHDKIVILEDTDADGKADKHTVFADDLYLPLGFEFGDGGVYVSQEPDILLLKDTDGDDKADLREVVLTGFGSEDSHHATHAFTFGQDGALYFNEGTFLNSQVETPYGPIRSYAGATYRYEPRTAKLTHYISYPYYNPWGSIFDKWGTHLIGDASDGSNYFAPPMTGNVTYPDKHPRIDMFTETRVRPTAGIEIVSSRQFPDDVQGNFLVNNNIGFQGTKQHRIIPRGSGIGSKEVEAILQSEDPNFRPIDIEFGPDGGLYIVDWYNPLISHGENPPRDPARDKSHGRVWRITYKGKPALKVIDVSGQGVPQLLENLKEYEDRFRYRSRAQIRAKQASEVLPELKKWVAALDKKDPQYEHNLLEGLWLYQDFDVVQPDILKSLLHAKEPQARAAATKVLLYWRDRIPGSLELMRAQLNDPSARVRIEAMVALSYFNSEQAVAAAADIFQYPSDYYMDYAMHETFRFLKPIWLAGIKQGKSFGKNPKQAHRYLLTLANTQELAALPQTSEVLSAMLTRPDIDASKKAEAANRLAENQQTGKAKVLLNGIYAEEKTRKSYQPTIAQQELIKLLLSCKPAELKGNEQAFTRLINTDTSQVMQATGFAAWIRARLPEQALQAAIQEKPAAYLTGISMLPDADLKASYFEKVKELAPRAPVVAYPLLMKMTLESEAKTEPTKELVASLKNVPETVQNSAAFAAAMRAMKGMVNAVPENDRKEVLAMLENMGTIEIRLVAVEAKMAFDKKALTVPAGRAVTLIFENPDLMPHNVVIVKPGTTEKVGEAADAMASLKDGFEKHFVPSTPDVLFATPLVNSGKSFRLEFKAPAQPGEYPFICSFPGHWRVMQGILTVTDAKIP